MEWINFKDKNTGKSICKVSANGYFKGEITETKALLSEMHNINQDSIITELINE